jgi:hypothetical protein
MSDKLLTDRQRTEYERIKKTKGKAAADKWKADLLARQAQPAQPKQQAAQPTPQPAQPAQPKQQAAQPTPQSAQPKPQPAQSGAGRLLSDKERDQYEAIKKDEGKPAAENWKEQILTNRPQQAIPAPQPAQPVVPAQPPTVAPPADTATLETDLQRARELAARFYNTSPLEPVVNPYQSQMVEMLNRRQQLSDPNSTFYAAKRSADIAGIVERMREGLEGYNAAENQALREAMNREVEAQLATDIERARSSNAANLVFGGAAAAREDIARRGASRAKAQTEQDIFLKNIDERQRRLRDFTEMVTGTEADERRRAEEARRSYEGTLADMSNRDILLQQERNALEAQKRSAEAGVMTGLANILQGGRSTAAQNLAMEEFFNKLNK